MKLFKNKRKRAVLSFMSLVMLLSFICAGAVGCSNDNQSDDKKIKIVSTIFPGYDFARAVCQDLADVKMLLPTGGESHSYEPTAKDIIEIQNCDLFIYVGGQSDSWIEEILSAQTLKGKCLKMIEVVEVFEEEIVPGMQEDHHEHHEDHEENHQENYDEHVWTSPKNAVRITEAICELICREYPEHEQELVSNCQSYVSELKNIDSDLSEFFKTVENKTLIFGDRFPMRYFTEEYGLEYYAAFPGCAAETEPSAATISFLIDTVKNSSANVVYYIEFSNHLIADSIADAAKVDTAELSSCHNVTKKQFDEGITYIDLMRQNLQTLKIYMK